MMVFTVNFYEIIKRRNSRKQRCNKEWENEDFIVLRNFMENLGCRPPYTTKNLSLLLCDTKEKLGNATFPLLNIIDTYPGPCQGSDKIIYAYEEQMTQNIAIFDLNDFVSIRFKIPDKMVKLVEEKKAYDFQTLVGNVGGYIGLFLGIQISHYL